MRRILNPQASDSLFELLNEPGDFRQGLVRQVLRHGFHSGCKGHERLYLNIGHTGLNDSGFRTWVRQIGVRPIYFVHDLIPITHAEFCRAGERGRHLERMRTVLETAAGVIGNSEATLEDLATFARSEGAPPFKQVAALLGCDTLPIASPRPQPERPTFVILGTIEARKNHLMLLHIWSRIVREMGPRAPELLVIGQRGWECEQALDLLDRSELIKGAVIEISRCGDSELATYLRGARALLFPSLVEGYGLPLVEALQCGTPAIVSDLPVFRETAGDIPEYIDPLDGPAWARTILDYSRSESGARKRQLQRMAGYRPPTWKSHFATIDSWLATF